MRGKAERVDMNTRNLLYTFLFILTRTFYVPPGVYILIGAGGLVMLVGFFGCCGAVRESQCLLGSVSKNAHTS